jgi:hypothetical protein
VGVVLMNGEWWDSREGVSQVEKWGERAGGCKQAGVLMLGPV